MIDVLLTLTTFGIKRNFKVAVPSNYAEMKPSQFLAAIRLAKGWINEERFYLEFFRIKPALLKKLDVYFLYKLAELVGFIKDIRTPHSAFYLNALPGRLLAPLPKLRGVSFQQFMTADTFYSWYLSKEDPTHLNAFVASLFLKENESFTPTGKQIGLDLEKRITEVAKLPFDLRYSIFINWVLIKSWLGRSYPHLFPESASEANSKGDRVPTGSSNWLALFDQFVGDNIADIDAYKALPCMDAFRILNRRIKEAKKKR